MSSLPFPFKPAVIVPTLALLLAPAGAAGGPPVLGPNGPGGPDRPPLRGPSGSGAATGDPAPPAMEVFLLDGLRRVRPLDAPPFPPFAGISAARGEHEPFQVVVRAGREGLVGVTVEAGDLRGEGGRTLPKGCVSLFREHFIQVVEPSPKSREGAGWYPDALIPFADPESGKPPAGGRFAAAPFNVAPGSLQPVWADVRVGRDAAPGAYTGTVKVAAQGREPVTVELRLTVRSFALPERPSMRSNFGGFGRRLARGHKAAEDGPELRALERRYAAALAAHRLCPPIPGYLLPRMKPDGSVDPTETHGALVEWIEGFGVTGFPLSLHGSDPLGKDRDRNVAYLRSMYAYLEANGWEKLAYIYVLDEPNDSKAYEEVRRRAAFIHDAQPGIEVLCTEQPTPQDPSWGTLLGSVDIWVPLWPLFDEKAGAERLAAGQELWSYTALCQGEVGRDTPFWEIDFPLLHYRLPGWMSWRHGMTGLLYWTTVYWEKAGDPWTNPLTYGRFNGEGSLFYPGADAGLAGPVASMRLEQVREGLEDYEYLCLLAARGERALAGELARRVARSWTEWEADPARLYAVREEIARRLEEK
ncbi:MAG: DUF4091 domain-containing protein [Planctomycetes bacterium]|nr:DUF4091 domain-containing protein [Planctomycetota bacterium]